MTPVYVFAKWQVKAGNLDTVLSLLKKAAEKSRKESGNILYKLHQSTADANTILLYEGYADQAAADAHRNSDHFQEIVVKSIIPLLEMREVTVTTALAD